MPPRNAAALLQDFKQRVKAYEAVYETIEDNEDRGDIQYIKLYNVGQKVVTRNCKGYLPSQVAFYLQVNLVVVVVDVEGVAASFSGVVWFCCGPAVSLVLVLWSLLLSVVYSMLVLSWLVLVLISVVPDFLLIVVVVDLGYVVCSSLLRGCCCSISMFVFSQGLETWLINPHRG